MLHSTHSSHLFQPIERLCLQINLQVFFHYWQGIICPLLTNCECDYEPSLSVNKTSIHTLLFQNIASIFKTSTPRDHFLCVYQTALLRCVVFTSSDLLIKWPGRIIACLQTIPRGRIFSC